MKTIEVLRDALCYSAIVPTIFILSLIVDAVSGDLESELKTRACK